LELQRGREAHHARAQHDVLGTCHDATGEADTGESGVGNRFSVLGVTGVWYSRHCCGGSDASDAGAVGAKVGGRFR
jgi:hypothetical protein